MKKFDINEINTKIKIPPILNGYDEKNTLFGGYRIVKESQSDTFNNYVTNRNNEMINNNLLTSDVFDDQTYLIMLDELNNFKKQKIIIVELGIGNAMPSLSLAGLLDNTDLYSNIIDYEIIAIEGDQGHFNWASKALKDQIKGKSTVIHGAITDYDGTVGFHSGNSANNYGQAIGGNTIINCYSLDTFLKNHNIKIVDILHMDIQGEELNVIKSSLHLLNNINFIYIATHSKTIHNELINIFKAKNIHEIILDIPSESIVDIENYGKVKTTNDIDGTIFCKLKTLM